MRKTPDTEQKTESEKTEKTPGRRIVKANLIEATPGSGGVGQWLLASPFILFVGWLWVDIFIYWSPIPWYWLEAIVAVSAFLYLIILPLGYLTHWVVTSWPRPFQHSGWDVHPLETLRPQEAYMVRFDYQERERAEFSWERAWLRAAQGWVYLEIVAIFVGALLIIPIFMSASNFGFGRF